jgi:hypothetical protein
MWKWHVKLNWKVTAITSWLIIGAFAGGYMVRASQDIHGPSCDRVFLGPIPPEVKPVVQNAYPNQTINGIYAIYVCTNGTTDAVKGCDQIVAAEVPPALQSIFQLAGGSVYGCKVA